MRRLLPVLLAGLAFTGASRAQGLLVPADKGLPPLAMLSHHVRVAIDDQVAVTRVEQVFRNDTDRPLEATYVFPVPKGASVRKFSMWVDGKEVHGELVEAGKAKQIYTDIVRRTQDPGLLEYLDGNLLKLSVFPVPAHGEQKLALSFTAVAPGEDGLVEYTYPLRGNGKGAAPARFSLDVTLKSQHPIQNVYSPSHPVTVTRDAAGKVARVHCGHTPGAAAKDFQLYYTAGGGDVGLTALLHRPDRAADGHFLLLISPRAELSHRRPLPRDMVFVLDTSGSMQGTRIRQARAALQYCLRNLDPADRFGLISFASTVNTHTEGLVPADPVHVQQAQHRVEGLEAASGTDINSALTAALEMRSGERGRTFTVVFFTDGQPTVGETSPERILANVAAKNTAETRIFTFGVGDDVNAVLLDRLAERTRSVSTYVRESEDIEAKVSSLYAKISHPVLTGLKLKVGAGVKLSEVYPPQLPDLFHGGQLVVLGRYSGHGRATVTLTGSAGKQTKEFTYEVNFRGHTGEERAFVEDLWARRKVGYLLDQIRGGENKELVQEVVRLAKRYGIATPYTSYLVVPDAAAPVANGTTPPTSFGPVGLTPAGTFTADLNMPIKNSGFNIAVPPYGGYPGAAPTPAPAAQHIQFAPVFVAPDTPPVGFSALQNGASPSAATPVIRGFREADGRITAGTFVAGDAEEEEEEVSPSSSATTGTGTAAAPAANLLSEIQTGKLGVDLSVRLSELRNQTQVTAAAAREAFGRRCLNVGGAWIDADVKAGMKVVAVKAQGAAYFRILERQPRMREVFRLGNRLAWVSPSQTVLVVGPAAGREQMSDEEIDRLFAARK